MNYYELYGFNKGVKFALSVINSSKISYTPESLKGFLSDTPSVDGVVAELQGILDAPSIYGVPAGSAIMIMRIRELKKRLEKL